MIRLLSPFPRCGILRFRETSATCGNLNRFFSISMGFKSTFKEQPIAHSPKKPDLTKLKKEQKSIFSTEELEAAKLARLAAIEPWLVKLPEKWIPYAELMRLEKPVGSLLLLLPSLWGITMASYAIHAPISTMLSVSILFSIGALVMRGAGCTINDLLDRNLDNKVARTIERPIASGRVNEKQAVAFLAAQCFVGLFVLLSLPFECFYLGALSLPFVATYPLFKRFTYYPQVWLSICFSWGCLLGFPAVGCPLLYEVAVPLFLSNLLFCVAYDTVYAHQDKEFDIHAGIKSTALAWGSNTKPILYGITATQALFFSLAGFMNGMGPGFYACGIWGFTRLFQRLRSVNLDDPKSCWGYFTSNIGTAAVFWLGMIIDYALQFLGYL